jgi:hypothetical protein
VGFSIYRRTRSVRLTVTTPDGQRVVVENMRGDQGFRLGFNARRTMDESPGEFTATAVNLPADALGIIEAAGATQVDDLDAILSGKHLQSAVVNAEGDDALAAGFLVVEVEAGYDGVVSRVFRAVGARARVTWDADDVTSTLAIEAAENLDGMLLGLPLATFSAGEPTFAVVDYLRRIAGLGPGNATYATFTAVVGDSRLDSPYHASGGQALDRLRAVLQYLNVRWFVDDRELWICGRDEVVSPTGALPWIADGPPLEPEPLIARPTRVDGGRVQATCVSGRRSLRACIASTTSSTSRTRATARRRRR